MNIGIKVLNLDKLEAAFKASPKYAAKKYRTAIAQSAQFTRLRAVNYAPVNKGQGGGKKGFGGSLRQSIKQQPIGEFAFAVVAGAAYAEWVDQGTRPHVILPRSKPFLAFQVNGRWVRAKRVNHPGTKPTYFFTNAAKDGERYLNNALSAAMQDVINNI